jgi:hypothetical protein
MNRRKTMGAVVALLWLAITVTVRPADAGPLRGWELIGQATVTDARDHDTIAVTRAQGTFRRVQVKVLRQPVQFREMTIHFASGGDQTVELREVIRAGGASRVIDVDGADRVIRSIEFRYDAQSRGRRAVVRIYGLN